MISVDEALEHILNAIQPLPGENVALAYAAGRTLAAPLAAGHSQPPFDASSMDGYAVRSTDLGSPRTLRLVGTAQAGQRFSGLVGPGQCVRIFTGAPMPIGADAVVMQENVIANGNEISFSRAVVPGELVRQRGSVFAEGAALLPSGTFLTPARMSLVASANRAAIFATRRPKIALLATGDELVEPGAALGLDQIASANTAGLAALFGGLAEIADFGIVGDELGALERRLELAFETGIDVLVTTGGASVGERDHVQQALQALGVEMGFWQLAMRPGKPLMFGRRGGTLVFGLPGNPVSALATATIIVLPALRRLCGQADPLGQRLRLPLAGPLLPNAARRHFIRARVEPAPGGSQVMPITETDSGHILSLADADAFIVQPENDPGMPAGTVVDVIPLG